MVLYMQYWRITHYYFLFFIHSKQINSPQVSRWRTPERVRRPERIHLTRSGARPFDAPRSASSGES